MAWPNKFENIGQRSYDDVLDYWARRAPVAIEVGQHPLSNHISDIAEPTELPTNGGVIIGPVESRPLLSELYVGVMKAFNVNFHAQSWSKAGAYSNGSLHAFNSTFQTM